MGQGQVSMGPSLSSGGPGVPMPMQNLPAQTMPSSSMPVQSGSVPAPAQPQQIQHPQNGAAAEGRSHFLLGPKVAVFVL